VGSAARSDARRGWGTRPRKGRGKHRGPVPWTSYLIVPLFGLANAGIPVDSNLLSRAYTSPITLGIFVGYAVGKPFGVTFISALVPKLTRGRLRPPVGWASALCGGTLAGIGFTVPLLIAALAFRGTQLEEAKIGVLTAALWSAVATWLVVLVTGRFPKPVRAWALLGSSEVIVDLADPVDNERDHIRGPAGAPVTVVEYGDFECPYCGQAEPSVRELLGDLCYVWRHLPLSDVHPRAQLAAEASEAAGPTTRRRSLTTKQTLLTGACRGRGGPALVPSVAAMISPAANIRSW
jgi:hypothetical protein